MPWTFIKEQLLISAVQDRESIWNVKSEQYRMRHLKSLAFEQIRQILCEAFPEEKTLFTDAEIRKGWTRLRSYKVKLMAKKKLKSGSGASDSGRQWVHEDAMEFITDSHTADSSISNIDTPQTSSNPMQLLDISFGNTLESAELIDFVENTQEQFNEEQYDEEQDNEEETNEHQNTTNYVNNIPNNPFKDITTTNVPQPNTNKQPSPFKVKNTKKIKIEEPKVDLSSSLKVLTDEISATFTSLNKSKERSLEIPGSGNELGAGMCRDLLKSLNNPDTSYTSRSRLLRSLMRVHMEHLEDNEQ